MAGILDVFREVYRKMEDGFYTVLDWLDAHGVPAYSVHDWLEDRGIPAFPAFLGFILILASGVILWAAGSAGPSTYDVTITVLGPNGDYIDGAKVTMMDAEGYALQTAYTEDGIATFTGVPHGGPYKVKVEKEGYKTVTETLENDYLLITMEFEAAGGETKKICVLPRDADTGLSITTATVAGKYDYMGNEVPVTFDYEDVYSVFCAEVPASVDKLFVEVVAGGYKTAQTEVSAEYDEENPYILQLYPDGTHAGLEEGEYTLFVRVLYDGEPEEANVFIRKDNASEILATKMTDENGEVPFNVDAGKYMIYVAAKGEHEGWTAKKLVSVSGDTEVNIDLKEIGADTNGEFGDQKSAKIIRSRKPAEGEGEPEEFNITICAIDEVTGDGLEGAKVYFAGEVKETGSSGCARFENVPKSDEPVDVKVEAGEDYLPYETSIPVNRNYTYRFRIRVRDAEPEIGFEYLEYKGAEALSLVPNKEFTLHFSVTVPYHVSSAKIVVDGGGIGLVSMDGKDPYEEDVSAYRGRTASVEVPIKFFGDAGETVVLYYRLEYVDENGETKKVQGSVSLPTTGKAITCRDNGVALDLEVVGAVEGTLFLGKTYTAKVYYGKCDENVDISDVKIFLNGGELSASESESTETYVAISANFTVPEDEAEQRAKIMALAYDETGAPVARTPPKYYDVAVDVGSVTVDPKPSGEREGNTVVFSGYATEYDVCISSDYADSAEVEVTYSWKGETKSSSESPNISGKTCTKITAQSDGQEVVVRAKLLREGEELDEIVFTYPVVLHENNVPICAYDAVTREPVPEATVTLEGEEHNPSGTTDEKGCVTLTAPDDSYVLHVSAGGYLEFTKELGAINSDRSREDVPLFKPAEDVEVEVYELKRGSKRVAAVVPGGTYDISFRVNTPPLTRKATMKASMITEYAEEPLLDKEKTVPSNGIVSFKFTVPENVPEGTVLRLEYEANAEVQVGENQYEYKTMDGVVHIGVVPVELTCGKKSAAVAIALYDGDKVVNNMAPPLEGDTKKYTFKAYYGRCSGIEESPISSVYVKINGEGKPAYGASDVERYVPGEIRDVIEVTKDMGGEKVKLEVALRSEEGVLARDVKVFKVGEPLCVQIETDGTPMAGETFKITPVFRDCETGEEKNPKEEVKVYISGGTAKFYDGDDVYTPEFPVEIPENGKEIKTTSGYLDISCQSDYYACTVSPNTIWVFSEGSLKVNTSDVYVPPGSENIYTFRVTYEGYGTVYLQDRSMWLTHVTCTGDVEAEIEGYEAVTQSGGSVTIRFANYGNGGQCTIYPGGYKSVGKDKIYVGGSPATFTVKSVDSPSIEIDAEVPETIYSGDYTITGSAEIRNVDESAWTLKDVTAKGVCEDGAEFSSSGSVNGKAFTIALDVPEVEGENKCTLTIEARGKIGSSVDVEGKKEHEVTVKHPSSALVRVSANPRYVNLISNDSGEIKITVNSKEDIYVQFERSVEDSDDTVSVDWGTLGDFMLLKKGPTRYTVSINRKNRGANAVIKITPKVGSSDQAGETITVYTSPAPCLSGLIMNEKVYITNNCPIKLPAFSLYYDKEVLQVNELEPNQTVSKEVSNLPPGETVKFTVVVGNEQAGNVEFKRVSDVKFVDKDGNPVTMPPMDDFYISSPNGPDCSTAFCGMEELAGYMAKGIEDAYLSKGEAEGYVRVKSGVPKLEKIGEALGTLVTGTSDSTVKDSIVYSINNGDNFECGRYKYEFKYAENHYELNFTKETDAENHAEDQWCGEDLTSKPYFAALHINLGRFEYDAETGDIKNMEESGAEIGYADNGAIGALGVDLLSNVINELAEDGYSPVKPVGTSTPVGGDIQIGAEECPVDGIARLAVDVSNGKTTFTIHVCTNHYEVLENREEQMASDVADVIEAVFSGGHSGVGMITKNVGGKIYVLAVGKSALSHGGELSAYMVPGGTTRIRIDPDAILFSEYNAKVEFWNGNCKPEVNIFGANPGNNQIIDVDKSKPYIDVSVPLDEECMRRTAFQITLVPVVNGKEDTSLTVKYLVTLRPIALKFQDLVSALTCSNFSINDDSKFRRQVVASVIGAAVGGQACSFADDQDFTLEAGNYQWKITENSISAYPKGGETATGKELFQIKFDEFRVWVNKASKEEVKAAVDQATQNKEPEYLLKVEVVDPTTGIPQYTKETSKTKAMMAYSAWSRKTVAIAGAYTVACAAGVTACEAIQFAGSGGLSFAWSWKNLAYELPGCAIGGLLGAWTISLLGAADSKSWAGASILSMLAPMYLEARQYSTLGKGASSWIFRYAIGPLKPTLTKAYLAAKGKQTVTDTFEEIFDILKNARSTAPGVNYKDLPIYAFFGFDSEREWATFLKTLKTEGGDNGKAIAAHLSSQNRKTIGELSADDIKDLWNALEQAPEGSKLKNYANQIKKFSEKPESIVKRYGKEYRKQISFKKGLFCSAIGGLIGTSLAYGVFHTSASYDQITVDVCSNYSGEPVSIKVSSTHITSRHATIDACGAEKNGR